LTVGTIFAILGLIGLIYLGFNFPISLGLERGTVYVIWFTLQYHFVLEN